MIMYVDVVGRCNIKCPSCPIGNTSHQNHVGGSMSVGLFTKIIKKAVNESDLSTVGLYNWTEPLLHPQIGSLIKIVKSYGLGCLVSSNLNLSKNIEQVVEAVPDFLRVTVSGFTNGVYQKQHAGGDIEKVKANMQLLATLIKKHNVKIDIEVYYLRWLGNLDEEVLMQEFAENLGFRFTADWAWMSPVEKTVAILNDDKLAILYESPHRLAKLLEELNSIEPSRTIFLAKEITKLHQTTYKSTASNLYEEFKSINIRGEWVVVIQPKEISGSHLELKDIQDLDLAPRDLFVQNLQFEKRIDIDHVELKLICGKGGYVRSIARDLGELLKCFAYVKSLRRIWSCSLDVKFIFKISRLS